MSNIDSPAPNSDEPVRRISYQELSATSSMSAIGLVAAKMLHEHRIVTLMIDKEGMVAIVPPGEVELDLMPEHSALSALVQQGYTDQQLESYLKQREARALNKVAQQVLAGT